MKRSFGSKTASLLTTANLSYTNRYPTPLEANPLRITHPLLPRHFKTEFWVSKTLAQCMMGHTNAFTGASNLVQYPLKLLVSSRYF